MPNRKEFVRELIKTAGYSESEVAALIGLTRSTLSYHFKKNDIDAELYDLILQKLKEKGVNVEQTTSPSAVNYNAQRIKGNFFPVIAKCFAGDALMIFQESNIEEYTFFQDCELTDKRFALRVVGDSMSGNNHKSIDEGDIVLVDMEKQVLSGDTVLAVLQNGRELIKQYQDGGENIVKLISFNSNYPPIILKEDDIASMYRIIMVQPKPRKL